MSRLNPHQAHSWNQQDSINLRTFLTSETGRRLVARLRSERPSFAGPQCADPTAIIRSSAIVEGYEKALWQLFDFIVTPQDEKATAGNYPSLDEDAAWPDLPIPDVLDPLQPQTT